MKYWVVGEVYHGGLVEDEGKEVVTFRVLNKAQVGLCSMPVSNDFIRNILRSEMRKSPKRGTKSQYGVSFSNFPDCLLGESPV